MYYGILDVVVKKQLCGINVNYGLLVGRSRRKLMKMWKLSLKM